MYIHFCSRGLEFANLFCSFHRRTRMNFYKADKAGPEHWPHWGIFSADVPKV